MTEEMNSRERLEPYYAAATREARQREEQFPLDTLQLPESLVTFAGAIANSPGVSVIAEHKRRSPSEGDIRPDSTVQSTVAQYSKGGATALSILTQGEHFGGRIQDIGYARETSALPILRKDFINDEYQLYEAKSHGADAALLIVGGLSDVELRRLYREAGRIELDCLVEVHDNVELLRALNIEPDLIGVNNRNLSTLKVDLETTRSLAKVIPEGIAV
ncbi:MAG TPA: indole-3-glycerol-phosphate synthase, partial [Candidatus Saccharimonadales bacterium]|nr:indole-3-glycerol-phosphate synthase [Candidatus Saccharimonadales bacterium]